MSLPVTMLVIKRTIFRHILTKNLCNQNSQLNIDIETNVYSLVYLQIVVSKLQFGRSATYHGL